MLARLHTRSSLLFRRVCLRDWIKQESTISSTSEVSNDPLTTAREREKNITLLKQKFGDTSEEVQDELGEISVLYQAYGKFQESLNLLQEQHRIFLSKNDPIHFENGSVLHDMGNVLEKMGKYKEAADYYLQSREIAIQAVQRCNSQAENNIKNSEIIQKNSTSQVIHKNALLVGQLILSKSSGALGRVLERTGDLESSIFYYSDAVINFPETDFAYSMQNSDHPHYCSLVNPLIAGYAKLYLKQTEKNQKETNSTEDLSSQLISSGNLVLMKKDVEAYQKALIVQEEYIGKEHPSTVPAIANTAWAHFRTGNIAQTEELWNRILAIERRTSGPFSGRAANAISSLGIVKYFQNEFEEAERLMQKAIRIKEKYYPYDKWLHIGLLKYDLGHIVVQRDPQEAVELFTEAANIFRRILPNRDAGRRHNWYQLCLDSIAAIEYGKTTPPVKDFSIPDDEQRNLYDYGGSQLR